MNKAIQSSLYIAIAALSIVLFTNSLYGAFCFDDAFALLYNGDVHHRENSLKDIFFHDFWGHDITQLDSHKSYRPFTTISFRMNYLGFLYFGGNETRPSELPETMNGSTWQPPTFLLGLHIVNVLLHAAVSCYVYKLAKDIWNIVLPQLIEESPSQKGFSELWSEMIPFSAGLLFASHPAHVEAVASIVGRAELLSAILCLIAFDIWRHKNDPKSSILAIALVYASVLCKEITFATYGAFIVWDGLQAVNNAVIGSKLVIMPQNENTPMLFPSKLKTKPGLTQSAPLFTAKGKQLYNVPSREFIQLKVWRKAVVERLPSRTPKWVASFLAQTFFSSTWLIRTFVTGIAILLYLRMRRVLMGESMVVQNFRRVENPLAYIESTLSLLMSGAFLHANYLWILVFPQHLSCDWSFNCIPLISSLADVNNLYTAAAYALIVVPTIWSMFMIFKGHRFAMPVLFCIFWGILFFMPASNLFFFVGTMLAERVLYLPSITFCVLIPIFLERVLSAARITSAPTRMKIVAAICIIIVALYSQRTWTRGYDWVHNEALFESAEKVCPDSAKIHFNLGILRTQQKQWAKSKNHFRRVLEIEPNYCEVNYRRALMYIGQNMYQPAIIDLTAALDCIYTRADSANALHAIYKALMEADPANASVWANAWNDVVRKLEPILKAEREGVRPYRQG